MKKAIQFMLLAALVVSVSGCANTNHPQAIRESSDIEALRSEIDENAVPKETLTDSFSESKTSSDDSVIDVKAETESSQAETPQPTAEQSPALGIQSPQTVVSNDTPKPESSKAVEPTTEPKPTPTQQPTQQQAEEKPTPEPALTESPQETAPPAEPTAPDFNIDYWIGYARSYAESVVLRLESTAVDCWDNPITAGAYSACLDRDIESRLNRYSRDEDITDVWIWAQARSDGSYDLYIGYA